MRRTGLGDVEPGQGHVPEGWRACRKGRACPKRLGQCRVRPGGLGRIKTCQGVCLAHWAQDWGMGCMSVVAVVAIFIFLFFISFY